MLKLKAPDRAITTHAALVAALEVDVAMAEQVRARLNALRDLFCQLMARPAREGGPSPVKCFADAALAGDPAPLQRVIDYASAAIEPESGQPFLTAIGMHEHGARGQIARDLPIEAREIFEALGPISLQNISTGYDPFQDLLEETMQAVRAGVYAPPVFTPVAAGKYFCPAPFEFATVDHTGSVFMCCPAWLTKPCGNLAEDTWETVWNSPEAQEIRASILDGSFRHCNAANCPHLRGQNGRVVPVEKVVNPRHREIIQRQLVVLGSPPEDVTIQYDPTCNLTCPSCRCGVYKANREESALTKKIHDRVWTDLVQTAKRLTIAGNGDPFASKLYRDALRAFRPEDNPNVRLALITNGLLLTPEMWGSIANCHAAIESIHVSFNAATPDTFRVNQRGGELEALLANLGPLSEARRRGEFPLLSLGFYVLDNNFREMRDIVEIGKKYLVDRVLFGHIMPPPYMVGDDAAYRAMAVHLPGHHEHEEFLARLHDPMLRDPIVEMTNLTQLMQEMAPAG
jgi:MoaA/NifB/PqqE/SkfB family radical SAM enzyme